MLKRQLLTKSKEFRLYSSRFKNKDFSKDWLRDNTLENISDKNPFYGEYTFYYWYWKNLQKIREKTSGWVFVHRELWGEHKNIIDKHSIDSLLKSLPIEWEGYDAIIGEPTVLYRPKLTKLLSTERLQL